MVAAYAIEWLDSSANGTNYSTAVGFISCAVSAVFYGTNFIPVKKFDTGDGMFFQWILCSAIFVVGLVLQMIRRSTFYPFVMLGGTIWATGNVCVVPIIRTIGLGLGLCIWGMVNLLMGWASGRFGWFHINASVPNDTIMNYIGVGLAGISTLIYSFVQPEVNLTRLEMTMEVNSDDIEPLLSPTHDNIQSGPRSGSLYGSNAEDILVFNKKRSGSMMSKSNEESQEAAGPSDEIFLDRLSPMSKKIVGISMAIFSGVLYGSQFIPALYIQDNWEGASQNSLDYVFAQYCGIYLTSTVFFVVYICIQCNKPKVFPRVILPGFVSGIMWGVATAAWFIANKALSEPISFPIITTVPGGIALFLGIVIFREIKGKRNIVIVLIGLCFTITGAVLAGLSKA